MENIYNDFTTKLLPQIQEGLVITKDYFTDLFSRYVQYLIVIDTLTAILGFIILLLCVFTWKKVWNFLKENDVEPVIVMYVFPIFFGCSMFFGGVTNLVKDIYIPEVRVYEELRPYITK